MNDNFGIYHKDLFGHSKYEQAVNVLRMFCAGKKVLCAFSGGKDSQCCYHLLKDAGIDFHAEYSITRFEPPELIRFIRENYKDVTFRRAYKRSLVIECARRDGRLSAAEKKLMRTTTIKTGKGTLMT